MEPCQWRNRPNVKGHLISVICDVVFSYIDWIFVLFVMAALADECTNCIHSLPSLLLFQNWYLWKMQCIKLIMHFTLLPIVAPEFILLYLKKKIPLHLICALSFPISCRVSIATCVYILYHLP